VDPSAVEVELVALPPAPASTANKKNLSIFGLDVIRQVEPAAAPAPADEPSP
jgi:hypothetical protein